MKGCVFYQGVFCGILEKLSDHQYTFTYDPGYNGPSISLTMPSSKRKYVFSSFPPFFDGLLPEGLQLEALLRSYKLDADDYMEQLFLVGSDLVGAVTVERENG